MQSFKTDIDIEVTERGLLSQLIVNQTHEYNIYQTDQVQKWNNQANPHEFSAESCFLPVLC